MPNNIENLIRIVLKVDNYYENNEFIEKNVDNSVCIEFKSCYNEETYKFMKVMRVVANKGNLVDPDDPEAYEKEIELHNNTI